MPGGSINIIPDDNSLAPEQGHTLAVHVVPEPATLMLLGLGASVLLRKRKA